MPTTIRGRSIKTTVSLPVQVGAPDVELFDLGKTVDRTALEKGAHRLIVGRLKASCCATLLRARITDGHVVGIEVERCKKAVPVDKHLGRTLQQAIRKLRGRKHRKFEAIPIGQFLKPAELRRTVTTQVEEACSIVCVPTIDLHHQQCFLCCIGRDPVARGLKSEITWCLAFPGPTPWPSAFS